MLYLVKLSKIDRLTPLHNYMYVYKTSCDQYFHNSLKKQLFTVVLIS